MPKVGGKKYAYTKEGKAQAKEAKKKAHPGPAGPGRAAGEPHGKFSGVGPGLMARSNQRRAEHRRKLTKRRAEASRSSSWSPKKAKAAKARNQAEKKIRAIPKKGLEPKTGSNAARANKRDPQSRHFRGAGKKTT